MKFCERCGAALMTVWPSRHVRVPGRMICPKIYALAVQRAAVRDTRPVTHDDVDATHLDLPTFMANVKDGLDADGTITPAGWKAIHAHLDAMSPVEKLSNLLHALHDRKKSPPAS